MSTDVQVTFINNSMNPDKPTVFVFTKNKVPTFDALVDGVVWRVMPNIGKGASSRFVYPIESAVRAMWGDGNATQMLEAQIGQRYTVLEDNTGIVLQHDGQASQPTAIEVHNRVQVPGGVQAQIYGDGNVLMRTTIVAYGQKATFVLHPKLYWGIASEIQPGQTIASAVLHTDRFFEQDIEGVSKTFVRLTGNPKDGYEFVVENVE